jgi:hypothetical protein
LLDEIENVIDESIKQKRIKYVVTMMKRELDVYLNSGKPHGKFKVPI